MEIPERAQGEDTFLTPAIKRGDVLIFDNYCPHRTAVGDAYREGRTSLDVRLWRFDTKIAASLISAGHGPVVMLRDDWIQPIRKVSRAEAAPLFEQATQSAVQGGSARDRRVVARAFARAQAYADGVLVPTSSSDGASEIDFDRFVDLCTCRFELVLEEGRRFSFASEATDSAGMPIDTTFLGDGLHARDSIDAAAVLPLMAKVKSLGARYFGAVFLGAPGTGACEMVFYDLRHAAERFIAGTIVRDRCGNAMAIDVDRRDAR